MSPLNVETPTVIHACEYSSDFISTVFFLSFSCVLNINLVKLQPMSSYEDMEIKDSMPTKSKALQKN